jgi:hypothetical protein
MILGKNAVHVVTELAARADDMVGRRSRSGSRTCGPSAHLILGRMALRESGTWVQTSCGRQPGDHRSLGSERRRRDGCGRHGDRAVVIVVVACCVLCVGDLATAPAEGTSLSGSEALSEAPSAEV